MKKLLVGSVALIAVVAASPASAADLPRGPVYKAAPVAAPVPYYTWTGFYAGLNAGVEWDRDRTTFDYGYSGQPSFNTNGYNLGENFNGFGTGAAGANAAIAAALANGFLPSSLGSRRTNFIGGGQIGANYQMMQ